MPDTGMRPFALFLLLIPAFLEAKDRFPERLEVEGQVLERAGETTLRVALFFTVYDMAFYVGEGNAGADWRQDIPRRIEARYFRDVSAAKLNELAEVVLGDVWDGETKARHRENLDRIEGWYRDVRKGDTYALTYLPGQGLELALNGEPLGRIEDADFATFYFAIWLADHPKAKEQREDLRGPVPRE